MSCPHTDQISHLQQPKLSQSVHREECTQCFDNQDSPDGIDVCLVCFNGGCLGQTRHHARTHVQKSGHRFTLNIKRTPKPASSPQRSGDGEPPAKMTKLAIAEEREEDKYEWVTTVKCWICDSEKGAELPDASSNPKIKAVADGVMQSMSSARQSEVKAWEEEITPCEHTLTLEQIVSGHIPASGLAHCNACDLKDNLWLCLACGTLGCGRQQWGGTGGNGHGLEHFQASQHPVSVKLGTITPEGSADVYCYLCDESKEDPDLAKHLAAFGINVQTLSKTEKSMTELNIEQNLKYDFSLTGDNGKALEPVFGPGLTGLANLGNSCYMASVLQTVFSLPSFQMRYNDSNQPRRHADTCSVPLPADCLECQMLKVADGLLSGRYSHPAQPVGGATTAFTTNDIPPGEGLQHPSPTPVFQAGVKPTSFKALIGKGHEEFATMRQQDAEEFFTHLITVLRRDGQKYKERIEQDPTTVFTYATEQRLQCTSCDKVRYRTDVMDVVSVAVPAREKGKDTDGKSVYENVQLTECIDHTLEPEGLEYACPSCRRNVNAIKQSKFASFPEVLVVHAKKFQLANWVPAKLDIPVNLPENDELQFTERHLGRGLQPGELELPNDAVAVPSLPQFNEAAMAQLEGMGFPTIRCQKALLATGNNDAEAAMEWLFAHMEDPDIDAPIQISASAGGAGGPEPNPEQVAMLVDMGFTTAQAKKALRETGGNAERAVEWLFNHPDDIGEESAAPVASAALSGPAQVPGIKEVPTRYKLVGFISHKGPSVHSGHYVAHIRKKGLKAGEGDEWVLFNDEKVVKADGESVNQLKQLAYLYFFCRV
ncbi:ubiquitin carboxyl-terminal hydrolase 14 [Gymnopilus junonius]|uniref:Ubiquitin carboxyl-terminal hydrolase n=1 Tax=Gymnopilus junonius TaxID=109634 RepID=A0A9P5NTQ1_GYMJU|nr:ubiquitin carboxyl-terminal hydrolase 14 [Gymnopilus junonius]